MATEPTNDETAIDVDVLIIGGDIAGLAAADRIARQNADLAELGLPPITYKLFEGSGRLGGRTFTDRPDLGYLDFGGQFLSQDKDGMQTVVHGMVKRFKIATFDGDTRRDADSVFELADGTTMKFRELLPEIPDAPSVVARIEMLERGIARYKGHPWDAPMAATYDQMSVADWAATQTISPATRELLTVAVRSAYSVEPRDISFLHFLHYGVTCGTFENYELKGDSIRFTKGTDDLVQHLADAADRANIHLNTKVTDLTPGASAVRVTTAAGTVLARRVVIAMSPSASRKIAWTSGTPEARAALTAGAPMARTIKGFAVFAQPFWKPDFSGYAISSKGPIDWIKDVSAQKPDGTPVHCLMTFIVGDDAIAFGKLTDADQKKEMLEQCSRIFGPSVEQLQSLLVEYPVGDWGKDPFAAGCPAGCFRPGVLTGVDKDGRFIGAALKAPVGRVHFAGSETSDDWQGGYMNGALDSGIRVAEELIALL